MLYRPLLFVKNVSYTFIMKKYLSGLTIGLLLGAAILLVAARIAITKYSTSEPFHEHANFAVFLNGERYNFSKILYMSSEPCTADTESKPVPAGNTPEVLHEVVHLHDQNGGVVHVHRQGITWSDFFTSLNMKFSKGEFVDDAGKKYHDDAESAFRYFVNGKEVSDITRKDIRDLDSVLITFGPRNQAPAVIASELTQIPTDSCQYSGPCPSRGPAPAETCGALHQNTNWFQRLLGVGEQ